MGVERSELAAEAWRQRYIREECELEEMEAGVGRALAGGCSDEEWLRLAHDRRLAAGALGVSQPQSLESVDAILKSLYKGPIRDLG